MKALLASLPAVDVLDGHWERAGLLRGRILAQGRKARLRDTPITRSSVDHDVELVTRDRDFIAFARAAGLRLLPTRAGR